MPTDFAAQSAIVHPERRLGEKLVDGRLRRSHLTMSGSTFAGFALEELGAATGTWETSRIARLRDGEQAGRNGWCGWVSVLEEPGVVKHDTHRPLAFSVFFAIATW